MATDVDLAEQTTAELEPIEAHITAAPKRKFDFRGGMLKKFCSNGVRRSGRILFSREQGE